MEQPETITREVEQLQQAAARAALLFAHYGDRLGRRALAASILLMAVVTAGIDLLPGYGSIGWLAPALLVLLRAGQGAAIGGEYGGSAALVVEYAPATRRGWYGGWQWATIALGLAAGIATAAALSETMDGPALRAWGWRLAFLLALPLGMVGLWIRLRIEETPGFRAVQCVGATARAPLADTLRTARRSVVVGFGIVAAVTATFNIVFVFLPGHLAATGRAPLSRALAAALIGLALGTLVPSTFLAELFPTRRRYSGLSLTYGLGSALFGGTAPALAAFLVRRTGVTLSPPGTPPP
jgi:MHS family proline/betaine transporter-like MFS transporter